jgi:U3 small nucleolar RNA-associated protein 6
MADKVRFVMDRMAMLFRQLSDLEIFTVDEVKSIIKRRTDDEYLIQRRQLTEADYYTYLQYEINLEKLREIRCFRLTNGITFDASGKKSKPAMPVQSVDGTIGLSKEKHNAFRDVQSAFMRHISYVFERAIRRFPASIELWNDYIAFLQDKKATSILNTAFGKALSLHPKHIEFWVQAAVHELETNGNSHAARVLLQRGIRANKLSKKLWLHYFEFEMWNGARISERQKILEIRSDDAALLAAPMVVFRHAALALPNEVEFFCQLHRSSKEVSDALAANIALELKRHFSNKARLWEYLLHDVVHEHQQRESKRSLAEIGKKRKINRYEIPPAADVIWAQVEALTGALDLVKDAQQRLSKRGGDDAEDCNDAESKKEMVLFSSIAATTFSTLLDAISVQVSTLTPQSLTVLTKKQKTEVRRMKKALRAQQRQENGETQEAMPDSQLVDYKATQHEYEQALLEFDSLLAQVGQSLDNLTAESLVPESHTSAILVQARIDRLLSCLQRPHRKSGHVSFDVVAQWIRDAVARMTSSGGIRTGSKARELDASNSSAHETFCEVGLFAVDYAKRLWAEESLNALTVTSKGSDCSGDGVSSSSSSSLLLVDPIQLRGVLTSLVSVSDIVLSSTNGPVLVRDLIELAVSIHDCSLVDRVYRLIISSRHCPPPQRGQWCEEYVRFAASHRYTLPADPFNQVCNVPAGAASTDHEDSDDDSDDDHADPNSQDNTAVDRLRHAYRLVTTIFDKKPHLTAGTDVKALYDTVIALEKQWGLARTLFAKSGLCSPFPQDPQCGSEADGAFLKAVAEKAVIERQSGNHQAANHLKWRRKHAT